MLTKRAIGNSAETAASQFLQAQGLALIERNYACRRGEIDLIMRDNQQLVFVEVKYRRNVHYGSGAEAVTYHKRQKILQAARHYLHQHQLTETVSCRFDIISMTLKNNETYSTDWLKHAFEFN